MIGEFVALLFLSRDYAHRAHLATSSHAQHVALGAFYDGLVPLADKLTEAYQGWLICTGVGGKIEIPYMGSENGEPTEVLVRHLKLVCGTRYTALPQKETAMQNIVDEIVALYYATLYQLSLN